MTGNPPSAGLEAAAPCPACGYDLRGHPDHTRCSECGAEVHVSAAISDASRWLDQRMLDLWSIAVLQSVCAVAVVVSVIAIHQGQFVALLLGLMTGVGVVLSTLWFLAISPGVILRTREPFGLALGRRRVRRLRRWWLADAALTVFVPALFILLTRLWA